MWGIRFFFLFFSGNNHPTVVTSKIINKFWFFKLKLKNILPIVQTLLKCTFKVNFFLWPGKYYSKEEIVKLISKLYPIINVKCTLTIERRFTFFFKDRIVDHLCLSVIYLYSCGDWESSYVGQIKRQLKTKINQHRVASVWAGWPLKESPFLPNAIIHFQLIRVENFKIINKSHLSILSLLETIFSFTLKPILNVQNTPSTFAYCLLIPKFVSLSNFSPFLGNANQFSVDLARIWYLWF